MNNLNIRTRVLLLTLIPLLIISLILGYYLARSRIQDSENSLRERGDALARHLARESEFGLFSEDARQLGELAAAAVREEDVYEITITNAEHRPVTQAYSPSLDGRFDVPASVDDMLIRFVAPVYRSGVAIADHGEQLRDHVMSLAQDGIIGWIDLKLSRASTLERQRQILRNIVLLTLASAVLCALLALWMAKGIVQPIMRLSHAVDGIRKGRLSTRIENDSGGEIGDLESGFNDMAAAMEKAQSRLHDEIASATHKLSLLLESLPVAVYRAEFADRCRTTFITPNIRQLTGFDAEEFTGDPDFWLDRIHPDDRDAVQNRLSLLAESGAHEFEYRWQLRDGGYHWFYSYARVYVDGSGPGVQVIGIWQDITEIKKVSQQLEQTVRTLQERNQELDQSRNEAITASRDKATFLANMSHEIRTPLSSIIGYACKMQAALKTTAASDEIRECAHIINHASAQLKHIIDDILSFSKLESGSVRLDQVPFDLRETFEDVVCMMSTELGDRRVELSLLFDTGVPTRLIGDPGRINQVLINLLSNAIKFTCSGSVDVLVATRDESAGQVELEISVTDTGIGMTEDVMRTIFSPFQQGDATIARRYGGTGLGLSIVSRLIELWDGDIGVESAPGNGSRFWFTLKCRRQETDDDFSADVRIQGSRILLYDDHQPALRAARNLLLAWSNNVYQARSRCQIKSMIDAAAAAGEPYDLVIIGAGIKDDEVGSLALNVLLDLVRESHDIPILLLTNRQHPISLGRAPDDRLGLLEKPLRRDLFHQQLCRLLGLEVGHTVGATAHGTEDAPRFDGMRVLLAEDNEFNQALITAVLKARGLRVTQVQSGVQAMARAAEETYDLVIMDIHLPGMDGAEAARCIRTLKPAYRTVPIIALTADVFFDTPDNLANAGIDACLLKPLHEDKLWRLIGSLRSGRGGVRPVAAATDGGRTFEPIPATRDLTAVLPGLTASLENLGQRLDEALGGGDPATLRAIVHELKGVICYFGITELSHTVLEADRLLNSGSEPPAVALTLRRIRKQVTDFVAAHGDRLREFNLTD